MDTHVFESSTVDSADYNFKSKELTVFFLNKTSFTYSGIPKTVWENFKNSESPGRFVHQVLRQFNYDSKTG